MKSYQIFLALIIFFQFSSLTYQQTQEETYIVKTIGKNEFFNRTLLKSQTLSLNVDNEEGEYFLTILSRDESQINVENIKEGIMNVKVNNSYKINFTPSKLNDRNKILEIKVDKDNTMIEITSVLSNNGNNGIYTYEFKNYSIDQEEEVNNNSFIIFLDDEQDYEKFDMKFKFNEDAIKEKIATFGFICLPTNETKYIAQANNYLKNGDEKDTNLTSLKINETQFESKVTNKFRKKDKDSRKKNKPFLAFIFSVEFEFKLQKYSYSINSEIINIFLIVSIVIALVFAVITFFLIRRKQSSESTSIEGDSLLKDSDKGENEGKDENEGKEDNEEKDEKEEKKENEEKEEKEEKVINDDNGEEERKKIEAAEN